MMISFPNDITRNKGMQIKDNSDWRHIRTQYILQSEQTNKQTINKRQSTIYNIME